MSLSTVDFELLLQANRIISSKLDVEEVLRAVLELATKVVHAEASSLLLLDEKTDELYFDVALGSAGDAVKRMRLKVGEGIAGWVAKEKMPLIVNDVSRDERFAQRVDKSTKFQTRSILAVPMMAKGKLIGVIEALNKEMKQDFSETDREAFEIFASQSAIAIENARLFSDVLREKAKLNTVFAEMSEGVMLLDEAGQVLMINPAGGCYFGIDPAEATEKKFDADLFNGFENPPRPSDLGPLAQRDETVDFVRREGKDFYLTTFVHKLHPNPNSPEGYIVILRDTTEEKRGEMLKRNFLALISHKLKTPLTVILGYAPVLTASPEGMNEFQKKAAKSILNQSEHLSSLVDKLLRFSIVESGRLKKPTEKVPLTPLLEEAVGALQVFMHDKKAVVEIEPSLKEVPALMIDGLLTVEVFKNLIENAVKFNDKEEKSVTLCSSREDSAVTVQVRDNGIGIPSEEQEKIFQKFYQIENSFTGQVPGAGLGLSLCKKVVEDMGGTISVQSEIGKGSCFSVRFPLDK
ncbi:MAG: GAF domain-containing protein [Elusimicrobia bacterium]|nr:GAF domain-containing protein [Candidatus Obscuribacterium magneticum]